MKNHTMKVTNKTFMAFSLIFVSLSFICCIQKQPGRGEGMNAGTKKNEQTNAGNSDTTKRSGFPETAKPVVNVYMENSGSMYGYVDQKQKSMFQQSVYNYLVDIQSSGIPSSFNLNFINSKIIQKGTDVDAFINKITANDFQNAGGDGKHTDIAEMLKMVLENTSNDTVSIFISDCIFSPGKVNQPEAYLISQMISIKESFSNYLEKNPYTMVMIYQIMSPFNGKYYDYQDRPRPYSGERPYYILVIGNTQHLYNLKLSTKSENFIPGVGNYWCIFNYPFEDITATQYALLLSPKKGEFNRKSPKEMTKTRNDTNGCFMFSLASDMSIYQHLLENDYVYNVGNYARYVNKVDSKDFYMEICPNKLQTSPMTVDYLISTNNKMPEGTFSLVLLRQKPSWADEMTDYDDRTFNKDNEQKTYGLKYIFDGIDQAFSAKTGSTYTSMDIIVNK